MSDNPHAQPHDPATGPTPPPPAAPGASEPGPSGEPAPASAGGYAPPSGPGTEQAGPYAPPSGPGAPPGGPYAPPSGPGIPPTGPFTQPGTAMAGGYGAPPPHPGADPWHAPGTSGPMAAAGASPLGTLLDLGFTRRITPALAKIVHLVLLAVAGIVTLLGILTAIGMFATAGDRFIGGPSWVLFGFAVLVLSPLVSFLVVAFGRFLLEAFLDQAARRHPDADR